MVLVVICSLIVVLLALLLWARIVFHIDTRGKIFYLAVGRVLKASLEWPGVIPQPVFQFFGWKWRPDVNKAFGKKQKKEQEASKQRKSRMPDARSRRIVWRVLRSFQLREFALSLDTDDYVTNAMLYPLGWIRRSERVRIDINWEGENRLLLVLESRVIRILYNILKK